MAESIDSVSFRDLYKKELLSKLKEEFDYKSVMQVPRLEKIVVSQGVGIATLDKKIIDSALVELTSITGQKAVPCRAKKDVSNFKLRKGTFIGCKVTLRGRRMYEFLEKLIKIALPRVRDFRGAKKKFDGRGNYNMGISEQIIFPEISIDQIKRTIGMNISFITTAKSDKEAESLLTLFGIPFKKINN